MWVFGELNGRAGAGASLTFVHVIMCTSDPYDDLCACVFACRQLGLEDMDTRGDQPGQMVRVWLCVAGSCVCGWVRACVAGYVRVCVCVCGTVHGQGKGHRERRVTHEHWHTQTPPSPTDSPTHTHPPTHEHPTPHNHNVTPPIHIPRVTTCLW